MNRPRADFLARAVAFKVNGRKVLSRSAPIARLADILRDDLGLTGTKIGCNAGDCGACTVLLDGRQVCACLTALGQVEGREVVTVEGLSRSGKLTDLQVAFHKHGAAQCGICTPGMLMAAADLLARSANPGEAEVKDALGGVLCRCTGYQKIIEAVLDTVHRPRLPLPPAAGQAVGARTPKVDGTAKLVGAESYGADSIPRDAFWLRVIRSPHHRCRFRLGNLDHFMKRTSGVARVLTARDVPSNGFGIYPTIKDQPVLAAGEARFRGEAVAAVLGTREAIEALVEEQFPVTWEALPAIVGL
ncbi:MAG: 2Fe-2S iron-sulfur cluster-binding protein, partial [Burkholderiales bacterium]